MDMNKFEEMFMGKPDKRIIELENRIREYFIDTPDSMPNHVARRYSIEFRLWCKQRGYTNEEIIRAKRAVNF